jgi:hypothetical protein
MSSNRSNVLKLQRFPGGVSEGLRTSLCKGRYEIVTAGPNPEFGFIGSDPYNTNAYTGLVVPSTPTSSLGGRYLMMLARARFGSGEVGARLVGIRQYAEIVARIPVTPPPPQVGNTVVNAAGGPPDPPAGSTVTFRKEIRSPLWHPPDGDISWHVMILPRTIRDTRNPSNSDGVIYQNSLSPALLYQTIAGPPFAPTVYTPPNGGQPWGVSIAASLGNIHDLRYRWRTDQSERTLDIPVPLPCDVVLFASVRQNDPETNPSIAGTINQQQFSALSAEDQFLVAYSQYAQYGTIAGALVFDDNLGTDVPWSAVPGNDKS